MDARVARTALCAAAFLSLGAGYRTPNFVVSAPTPETAQQIGRAAEKYRRDLAVEWLGKALPDWAQPCPITAQVGNMGAGGATTFVFDHGEVFGWEMSIQGSLERILDSVLPHEVTHTIFASHFRRPLPRWADEGACSTVEHRSERHKQQRMLIEFLQTKRGIAFSDMFAMKQYPRDILPLYAQGHSLATFLIAQGGKRKYLAFVGDGLRSGDWVAATREHYDFSSLGRLQNTWLAWVRQGSPLPLPGGLPPGDELAGDVRPPRRGTDRGENAALAGELVPVELTQSSVMSGSVSRPQAPQPAEQVILAWEQPSAAPRRTPRPAAAASARDAGPTSIYAGRGNRGATLRR